MRTERVYLDGIELGERLRPLNPDRVAAIKSSISEIGLRTPITVMAKPDGEDTRMILVAGNHRLAALLELGEDATECFVIDDDEIDAKLWEVSENLHRADLSKEQRDEHIRLFAELLRQKEDLQSKQNAAIESKRADGKGHRQKGVASKIAEQTGLSKDTVRRALNPTPPKPVKHAPDPHNDFEVKEKQVSALMSAWNRAGREAREEFLARIDTPVFDKSRAA